MTLEEGTWAAWLYDVLKPHVREIVVCDPRRNALLKEGSKSDKVDARKLAELLRSGMLPAVYHGENGLNFMSVPIPLHGISPVQGARPGLPSAASCRLRSRQSGGDGRAQLRLLDAPLQRRSGCSLHGSWCTAAFSPDS